MGEALCLFLRSLPENSTFNIVGFGTRFCWFYEKPVKYTENTFTDALRRAKRMDASLGGTNILTPLEKVLGTQSSGGGARTNRCVFVLTDGLLITRSKFYVLCAT